MGRQRRRDDNRKSRKRPYDDDFDGTSDTRRRQESTRGRRQNKVKNERILLDILAENPEAEEELASE